MKLIRLLPVLSGLCGAALCLPAAAQDAATTAEVEALKAEVARLQAELSQAQAALAAHETAAGSASVAATMAPDPEPDPAPATKPLFPALEGLRIGGAVRVNYYGGDYTDNSPATAADAAGNGAVALDTFRVNVDYARGPWSAKAEYRMFRGYYGNDSYHFLHTGWIGYEFENADTLQVGVNRVPFGPGPYGISQSWFFDQHYYVGLADDMDLGVKYSGTRGDWDFDVAYYVSDEGSWSGSTRDSARYSYDVVNESGSGYGERNQFNARAIRHFTAGEWSFDVGASAQWGQLHSYGPQDDGDHYAFSFHPTARWQNWTFAAQLTTYRLNVDAAQPLGTDTLVQFGAYDFPTTLAADAWLGSASLSYTLQTPTIAWLDYLVPYLEYSSINKREAGFNDSELLTYGVAWAHGGWYIYTEVARSNGNDFVGNLGGFNSRFGANPNARWLTRYNLNFGYYY
ncbi:hypothetical protein [Actomonas aquatica]|uniref:Carbohydrate porin n=1 Tax=Actomonas aquatica TaxID=2866162 RepID=A0ABZ1C6T1_9BACT|nr:hypothetical protein [Opitutus sp. WL0086]WRQ86025.1 hypothetical protein K1X11_014520 [Opitutus sp. WL0086]